MSEKNPATPQLDKNTSESQEDTVNNHVETTPESGAENKETVALAKQTSPIVRIPHEGFSTFLKRGFKIITIYPLYALFAIILFAALDASLLRGVFNTFNIDSEVIQRGIQQEQALLMRVIGSYMLLNLLKVLFLGPLFAALVVYLGLSYSRNKNTSLYEAINFVIGRYGRLITPFIIAQLCIQLGMIVLIPGVLFMMQYAFVDAIACAEKEPFVLTRSKKMTRGIRGSLLWFILPWSIFIQLIGIISLSYSGHFLPLFAINFFTEALLFLMMCSFFAAYEYRSYQIVVYRAHKAQKEPPPRPLLQRKDSLSSGIIVLAAVTLFAINTIGVYTQQTSYNSQVMQKINKKIQDANTAKLSYNQKDICEESKKEVSETPRCNIICSVAYKPNNKDCLENIQWRLAFGN